MSPIRRGKDGKFLPKDAQVFPTAPYQPPAVKMVTLVNYILDRSGSMEDVKQQVIEGFQEYINGLKKETENEAELLFSLTLFDSGYNQEIRLQKPYIVAPISTVVPLTRHTYLTGGGTPLYDAIAETVHEVDNVIRTRNLKIDRILTVVHTDGQENTSKRNNDKTIRELRAAKEATGHWTFVYIGASPTTWADSHRLGFGAMNTLAYEPSQTKHMFAAAAASTMNYRAAPSTKSDTFFSGGSKWINGQEIRAKKRHEHLSSNGYTKYEAVWWEDDTWSCNCPSWAHRKTCKHIGGGESAITPTTKVGKA